MRSSIYTRLVRSSKWVCIVISLFNFFTFGNPNVLSNCSFVYGFLLLKDCSYMRKVSTSKKIQIFFLFSTSHWKLTSLISGDLHVPKNVGDLLEKIGAEPESVVVVTNKTRRWPRKSRLVKRTRGCHRKIRRQAVKNYSRLLVGKSHP